MSSKLIVVQVAALGWDLLKGTPPTPDTAPAGIHSIIQLDPALPEVSRKGAKGRDFLSADGHRWTQIRGKRAGSEFPRAFAASREKKSRDPLLSPWLPSRPWRENNPALLK